MIAIPTTIQSNAKKTPQTIPKIIIQTYVNNKIPEPIHNNLNQILKNNPEYDYRLITDQEAVEIIKTHFDQRTLNAFQQLFLGAAKGDFIRYIALYLYGGVYLDLDASINLDLNTFISPHDEFIFFINGDRNLEQFCFAIRPKHILMKKMIEEMITRIENKEPNIFRATGPTLFNDVIYNTMSNTNIYDTNKNLTHNQRGECYGKHNQYMGGKIVLRHGNDMEEKIVFRMKDAEIYKNPESISYFNYDQSANMHYIYTLF
jgi:mannosyltransferase OCH1-like enzyme